MRMTNKKKKKNKRPGEMAQPLMDMLTTKNIRKKPRPLSLLPHIGKEAGTPVLFFICPKC